MSVISVQVGATTQDSAIIATEVTTTDQVRIMVGTSAGASDVGFFGPVTPVLLGAHRMAKVTLSGLNPSTRYYYQVEHNSVLDTAFPGQFLTHPVPNAPASFTVWTGGDAGLTPAVPGVGAVLASSRISNHPIFSTISQRATAEDWLMGFHLGDRHYYDLQSGSHGIVGGPSLTNYRRAESDVMLQTNQHILYRNCPTVKLVDDHDFLANDLSGVADPTGAANWAQAYREHQPHYDLEDTGGVYFSVLVGRVLLVVLDSRYYASANLDPNDDNKTMLGAAQKTWLTLTLATTSAKAVVILMSRQWVRETGDDTWRSFPGERQELADLFTGLGLSDKMCMVWADRHAIKLLATQPYGDFPCMVSAPFDASGGVPAYGYPDGLPDDPGNSQDQYGTLSFDDDGDRIVITMSVWRALVQIDTQSFTIQTPVPIPIPNQETMQALTSGSHRMAIEARVVTTYQDGDDPVGEEIPVIAGAVTLDATADIYGTLALTTDGDGTWPQRAADLLSPFGNEIFVRRGVHFDGQVTWIPLGYFRIQNPNQASAPDGPIAITGLDRMAGLIDARLLAPRQYMSNQTVHEVFDDLVREIYPTATILFDDADVEYSQLGRTIASEDSRYDLLREVANSYGKIMYWDSSGFLRIETAPDIESPRWNFMAGRRGSILISASRSLSREGVYNAVVVTGEGAANDVEPVRAAAFDNNPASPTYFFGRFGQVPRFYSSSLVVTADQAANAARAILLRNFGFPYNVSFTVSPNPAIRPWDPVRVMYKDGKREIHVIEKLSIPLAAQNPMTGSTREQTIVAIGVE